MANANNTQTPVMTPATAPFSSPPLNQLLNQVTSIKLDRGNFLLWKNLALPILRSYKLEGHFIGSKSCPLKRIPQPNEGATAGAEDSGTEVNEASSSTTETVMNPQYEAWVVVDQLLLGWL